jgi:hypothetical protein
MAGQGAQTQVESWTATKRHFARIVQQSDCNAACQAQIHAEWVSYHVGLAKHIANAAVAYFKSQADVTPGLGVIALGAFKGTDILEGIQKWLDRVVFGGLSIATYAYLSWNTVIIAYGLLALIPKAIFSTELSAGDSFWLDANNLERDWSIIGIVTVLIGAVLTGVVLPALMGTAPEFLPLWVGFTIGFVAAVIRLLPRDKAYIDQEEQALGYAQS